MVLLASYSTPPVGGLASRRVAALNLPAQDTCVDPPPPPLRQPPPARPVLLDDLESVLGTFCCGSRGPCAETRKCVPGRTCALSCRTTPRKELRALAQ